MRFNTIMSLFVQQCLAAKTFYFHDKRGVWFSIIFRDCVNLPELFVLGKFLVIVIRGKSTVRSSPVGISWPSSSLTCLCLTGGRTSCFGRFAGGPSASGGLAAGRLDGGDPDGSSSMCRMVCVDAGRIMVGSSPKKRCRAVCKTTQTKRISVATRRSVCRISY